MKLIDIEKGSDPAYMEAVRIMMDEVEFALETCRRLLGTDPVRVLEILGNPSIWDDFIRDQEL